jgi:hypothetical protein
MAHGLHTDECGNDRQHKMSAVGLQKYKENRRFKQVGMIVA